MKGAENYRQTRNDRPRIQHSELPVRQLVENLVDLHIGFLFEVLVFI